VSSLCDELALIHAVDPFLRPSLTPAHLYWRLHGSGSHYASYSDAEMARLREWLGEQQSAHVMFNNIRARTMRSGS
jgi:uncharacterized protein YecE (DUF72 family)